MPRSFVRRRVEASLAEGDRLASIRMLAARDPALAKRVVFISGGGFTPETSEYVAQLDNRLLGKPFDLRELRGVVAEMVAGA